MTGKKKIFIQRKKSSRTTSKNFTRMPTRTRPPSLTTASILPSSPFQVTEAMPRRPTTPNSTKRASLEESPTTEPKSSTSLRRNISTMDGKKTNSKQLRILILLCITPVSFMSYVSPKHVEYVSLILKPVTCLVTLE